MNGNIKQEKILEYGKWYKCSEVMPEDFEELVKEDFYTEWVLVGCRKHPNSHYKDSRIKRNGAYHWTNNHFEKTTHWMIAPPITN